MGFTHRFCLASGEACQETGCETGRGAPVRATWPRATHREPNRRVVRPLVYEKQTDRTSISG